MKQKTSPSFKNGRKILAPADMCMEHLWTNFLGASVGAQKYFDTDMKCISLVCDNSVINKN